MNGKERSPGSINICHIATGDLWGGAEAQVATLLSYMTRMQDFNVSAVLFNEGRLFQELRVLGIEVYLISEQEHNFIKAFSKLMQYLQRTKIDIIHTHKPKDNVLAALASRLSNIHTVIRTMHGLQEPFIGWQYAKMGISGSLDHITSKHLVTKIVAVSLDLKGILQETYGVEKTVCIHNGIDLDKIVLERNRWDVRRELEIGRECYLIGTVGRLVPVKGHECLLSAMKIFLERVSDAKLILVGDGPLREQLVRLASLLGIEKQVIFMGHQDKVYDLINAMDVFVLPSLHEGMPMVLLEALFLGRPVVASRVGGMPEVIGHGDGGVLIDPGNPEELAQNLSSLWQDRPRAEQLGRAGKNRVKEGFTALLMAQRTADLYLSVLRR
jgi:L-malate glycosyltransferase